MDEESRELSLRLWDVMEKVGVSERMSKLRRDTSINYEIQQTIAASMRGHPKSVYIFGSSVEGTTTHGMSSDRDVVICDEDRPAIEHIQQAPPGESLLIVNDSYTRPGYVKLQLVDDGDALTINNCDTNDHLLMHDKTGKVCLKHFISHEVSSERSGPADTVSNIPGFIETDMVYAIRSRTFPRAAIKSLEECKNAGWLTTDDMAEMIKYGCLFVGVGHPSSEEKECEWRISFSFQERQLMFRLNATQRKCYVLMKYIKGMLIANPDVGKSVTSYHCKTCLFRVITKTKSQQWTPVNLIRCTLECLTELLQCLCQGECPNFFVRENNMFERRVTGQVKDRLIHYLRNMLDERCNLFYRIQCDNIGQALRGDVNRYLDMETCLRRTTFDIYRNACFVLAALNTNIAKQLNRCSHGETTRYLFQQLCYLASANTVTEHTRDETKEAIRQLEPVLHRFYAAHLASLALSTDEHDSKVRLLEASAHHLEPVMHWDMLSGRLLNVTILYKQGNNELCCNLLEQIEQSLPEIIKTVCACYDYQIFYTDYQMRCILSKNPDPEVMMKSTVSLCTIFHPSVHALIPTALQYELYRSVGTPPGSRQCIDDDWFDLAVVDSKIFLYFLQYLVYSHLNRPTARRIATSNIFKQLVQDLDLGHRETGYNLLGWIYNQEGYTETAAYCFLKSWMIRPHHNAAKWHMLILIYRQYAARQFSN